MANFNSIDHQMMARAIELARQGIYTTAPNPNVGCVITQSDVNVAPNNHNNVNIVGEGFHCRAGEPHAEVHALRMAGDAANGATAYVTLEPCSHYGRTPPCAQALIEAKVARVVCAMYDPNPKVSGKGVQMLQQAGIDVQVGLLETEAAALNVAFLKRMKTGMPFVQLKMAASLDGQTALANGQSQWITSSAARQDVQMFRAQAGAILSTSKTVIEDDASLNVRWSELPISVQQLLNHHLSSSHPFSNHPSPNAQSPNYPLRQPLRVILDRQKQLNGVDIQQRLKLFSTEPAPLLISDEKLIKAFDSGSNQFDLEALFKTLVQQHNINHIWVEAGATLARSLLTQQLVDELVIYLAPKLMGSDGRGLVGALGFSDMSQIMELTFKDVCQIGEDIRIIAQPKIR